MKTYWKMPLGLRTHYQKELLQASEYVHLRNWAWRKLSVKENIHKRTMLEKIFELLATRKYILLGDNTQHDLKVYLEFAKAHPANVRGVIIRQASVKEIDKELMVESAAFFKQHRIMFYCGTELPHDLLTITA